ncbi:MAG: M28 family peptidase [Candidatus Lokiarchaeota archaeon]|nr:M28 family peptidase [Candidatus Lokiarchaeota archaeon]
MEIQKLESKNSKKSITDMELDVDNAYRITEKIAFPRLVGSEGEKKAIKIVLDEFKNAGYNSISQDIFRTSLHIWIYIRYIFLILGSGLILLALSFYLSPLLTLGIIVIDLYLSSKALKVSTSTEIKLSKNERYNFSTENVFVNLKSKNSKCKVVFIGHWDSKSQTFPPSTRSAIFLIFILGSLVIYLLYFIFSILRIFFNLNIPFLSNILLDLCLIIACIGAINFFNKTGNASHGAFDNAAAVGTIIELARYYKENPLDNVDLVFLSTGSEELNLGGAIHFIKKYKDGFEKDTTFFINLDLIGGSEVIRLITSYGIPKKISSVKLNNLFLKSAEELKIKIRDIYFPSGVWSDFMPIVQKGFEACWIGSEPGLKFVHTINDTMNLVSKEGIKNALFLCKDVIEKLDKEFN